MKRTSLIRVLPLLVFLLPGCGLIPYTVAYTGTENYQGNMFVTDVVVAEGVTAIGAYSFKNCPSLSRIALPSSLASIEAQAFAGCPRITAVSLPEGLKTIDDGAFDSCGLTGNLTIPSSVTSIGEHAFSMNSISVAVVNAMAPPALGGSFAFAGNAGDFRILVPAESVDAYRAAWLPYSSSIESK